jgi:hypothetical protein
VTLPLPSMVVLLAKARSPAPAVAVTYRQG